MQTYRQKQGLYEIAQPIGGVKDYAEPTTTADKDQPMARRVASQGGPLLIVAAAVALTVAGVAVFIKFGG